jgi:hypothetical protein
VFQCIYNSLEIKSPVTKFLSVGEQDICVKVGVNAGKPTVVDFLFREISGWVTSPLDHT